MRQIVGNVSVITAGVGEDRSGLVVISMVSLSANPPKVIACVNRASSTWPIIERFGHFGVSSLAAHHQPVAERFSGFGGIKGPDRYHGAEWMTLKTGASLLKDATAVFDCQLDEMIDRGSHSIIVGSVVAVDTHERNEALVYWRGGYRPLHLED
ncbi:flavin reductase family protein [Arvimicrobium flavum]|uniref:flavin reductase family protein n=1 Tax=Arvimicrobium flavum TaxID=3393320 RepID=UPI00237B8B20|nr:flavin reductase family protein [Mesorhizobium shangrilense]